MDCHSSEALSKRLRFSGMIYFIIKFIAMANHYKYYNILHSVYIRSKLSVITRICTRFLGNRLRPKQLRISNSTQTW